MDAGSGRGNGGGSQFEILGSGRACASIEPKALSLG